MKTLEAVAMTANDKSIIYRAIRVYGADKQVVVAMEELCELSSAIAKYVRYDDKVEAANETRSDVIGEMADVSIVMETIKKLWSIDDVALSEKVAEKLSRLKRWLDASEKLQHTTEDR